MRLNDNALTTTTSVWRAMRQTEVSDADADLVISLINQASARVEAMLDRKLGHAAYTEKHKAEGEQLLIVREWPVTAVTSVKIGDEPLSPDAYELDSLGAYKDNGWPRAGYPRGLTGEPLTPSRSIEISYEAGFILPKDATDDRPATLPADIEALVIEMVIRVLSQMESGGMGGLKSFSISDVSWVWDHDIPQTWQATIAAHRRPWL